MSAPSHPLDHGHSARRVEGMDTASGMAIYAAVEWPWTIATRHAAWKGMEAAVERFGRLTP